jgi:thioredoxin-like negative regulator of GroEL
MDKKIILELNDKNWEKNVEKGKKPVIVMFYSNTCPHCHTIKPYFDKYAKDFKDKIIFAKVNIMNNPTIISRYGIMGTPTFKFFCNGKPIQEFVGAIYPTLLKKNIEDAMQNSPQCLKNTTWIDFGGITGYT